jgi:hypothetical protein
MTTTDLIARLQRMLRTRGGRPQKKWLGDGINEPVEVSEILTALETLQRERDEAVADKKRLDAIADESWELRCFTIPSYADDADVGWRVIQHHMQAPHERVVAEVFRDDPRAAIDAAIKSGSEG